jgi:flagellar motor component MotA
MAYGKGNLSEIDFRNINSMKSEELPKKSRKAVEEFQRALQECRKAFQEEMKAIEEKEMQALLSCFKKDRQGEVTQIQGDALPSVERKSIKIPEVKLNVILPSITLSTLPDEDVAHMVDQAVSASLTNKLQKMIDGSIDNRLESSLDSKICFAMLRMNDETAIKQI